MGAGLSVRNESEVPLLVVASQLTPLHWGKCLAERVKERRKRLEADEEKLKLQQTARKKKEQAAARKATAQPVWDSIMNLMTITFVCHALLTPSPRSCFSPALSLSAKTTEADAVTLDHKLVSHPSHCMC